MGAGRDEVCEETHSLTAALDQHRLVIGDVPRCRQAADPGERLRLAVDERERDLLEVGRKVARRRALVPVARELQLPPLDDIPRLGEARRDAARRIAVGIAARVIEMEVAVDHPAHVGGGVAELREGIFQLGAPALPFVLHAVDVPELLVFLVAEPRVHENQPVVVLDQETAECQGNPIALIGGDAALPQGFRHDAEHGAAVEPLGPALQGVAGQAADAKSGVAHSGAECGMRSPESMGEPLRIPHSAFRTFLCRGRSCSSTSCSRVSTPRSRARSSRARSTRAVASASPKARWRAGLSTPKNAVTWSSPRWRSSGTRRRVRRTVHRGLPPGAGTPTAAHSAARKRQSKRALWATNTAAPSARPRPAATSPKRGRPATIRSVIPVRRTTQGGIGVPGSTRASKARWMVPPSRIATATSRIRPPCNARPPVVSTSTTAKRACSRD